MTPTYRRALIVGSGSGVSASLARLFAARGLSVALAARNTEKLAGIVAEVDGRAYGCDVADPAQIDRLFAAVDADGGAPDVVVFNASGRARGPFVELDPAAVAASVQVNVLGGFHVAQAAARRMLPARHGAILFTGASASVKGYARSAPFAMGKFALRGLAQSMARELHPHGIHIGHVVIDGAIRPSGAAGRQGDPEDRQLDPDAIASAYWTFLSQDRSAWSWEVEVRPWVENF